MDIAIVIAIVSCQSKHCTWKLAHLYDSHYSLKLNGLQKPGATVKTGRVF